MEFRWRDFIAVASDLNEGILTSEVPEAYARCAVSRAYYAAFCHARNYARDHYQYTPANHAGDHQLVRQELLVHRQFAVARRLDKLRKWRNQCDYRDDVSDVMDTPAKALELARQVLDALT